MHVLSGHVSRDVVANRTQIRIVRCERPTKRHKPKPCQTKARGFFPFRPVGIQESLLKVPEQGQFHAAIRVTPKRCDSCFQGALGNGDMQKGIGKMVTKTRKILPKSDRRQKQGKLRNNYKKGKESTSSSWKI